MKVLDEGHEYYLENVSSPDSPNVGVQHLQFIKKEIVSGIFQTVKGGASNEEVLNILIDRLNYLNSKLRCPENEKAIEYLIKAKEQLQLRTDLRLRQKVEGTPDNHIPDTYGTPDQDNEYEKLPVRIRAEQLTKDNLWNVHELFGNFDDYECVNQDDESLYIIINTLEGKMIAKHNDFIIKGVAGEFYPCKPDIFEKTYRRVN